MTPQFEAACIAAATIMAEGQDCPTPQDEAIGCWKRFSSSGYEIGLGQNSGDIATAEIAQAFADWWETLTDTQRECVCNGSDITEVGFDGSTYEHDNGETVVVPTDCDKVLHGLFDFLGM